ncbi:MAG: sigma-70 family RNA polymerase sigma factor [Planctomycetota bacterium]
MPLQPNSGAAPTGDSRSTDPSTLDLVLARSDWLHGLARAMLRDESLVDEVVQKTLVAAMEHPPRTPRLDAWLTTVLRNFVRRLERDKVRRKRREKRVAKPEVQETPPTELELDETRKLLASEVLSLKDPYRSVVILHYYEGVSSTKIAELRGVSANTVRVQLKRGVDRLREQWERRTRGESEARPALAMLFWLGQEESVAAVAASNAPSGAEILDRLAREDAYGGAFSLKWVAFGVALLAIVSFFLFRDGPKRERSETPIARATSARPDLPERSPENADPTRRSSPPAPTATVVSPAAQRQLQVFDATTGIPVEGATVFTGKLDLRSTFASGGRSAATILARPFAETALGETNAQGELAVPEAALRTDRLRVTAPGYLDFRERTHVRDLGEEVYAVALVPAEPTTLEVLDATGRPLPGITMRLNSGVEALTDDAGELKTLWTSDSLAYEITEPGFVASRGLLLAPRTRVTLSKGLKLTARVLDARGHAVAHAQVLQGSRHWKGPPSESWTDENGEVELLSVAKDEPRWISIDHPDFPRFLDESWLPTGHPEFVLTDGIVVRGRVLGSKPENTRLRLLSEDAFFARDVPATQPTAEHGEFAFRAVGAGRYTLVGWHPERGVHERRLDLADTTPELEIRVNLETGAELSGRVVGPDGVPLANVPIQVGMVCGDEIWGPELRTDRNGHYRFTGLTDPAPTIRTIKNDLRWTAFDDRGERPARGYLLSLPRPYDLREASGLPIRRFGSLGSRNTVAVEPGEQDVDLVVSLSPERAGPQIDLRTPTGERLRLVTNLHVIPPDAGRDAVFVFGGLDASPRKMHDTQQLEASEIWVLSRDRCLGVVPWNTESAEICVLHPRRTTTIELVEAERQPRADVDLFVRVEHSRVERAVWIGRTNSTGRLAIDFLPPERFQLYEGEQTTPGRAMLTLQPIGQLRPVGPSDPFSAPGPIRGYPSLRGNER